MRFLQHRSAGKKNFTVLSYSNTHVALIGNCNLVIYSFLYLDLWGRKLHFLLKALILSAPWLEKLNYIKWNPICCCFYPSWEATQQGVFVCLSMGVVEIAKIVRLWFVLACFLLHWHKLVWWKATLIKAGFYCKHFYSHQNKLAGAFKVIAF